MADCVLAAIDREEETPFVRHKYARGTLQSENGPKEPIVGGVNDVDIIVSRMCDGEPGGSLMNRGVIEAAFLSVRGKLDMAQKAKAHRVACSNLALPSTLRRQYA